MAPDDTGPRCAPWFTEQGVDPIGSAGSCAGFLLVEWPLPWPRDLGEVEALAPVRAAAAAAGLRIQGLVPRFDGQGTLRVIRYAPVPGDGFAGYERAERLVPADQLVGAAARLAAGGDGDPGLARAAVGTDVLICAHGKRDVCCGSMGTALAIELAVDDAFRDGARLWRTSHTGGHRFAPTAIVLPQGTAWAGMDADALRRIAAAEGPLDDLLPRYRGCLGLGSPAAQAVEREAFAEVGWDWLRWRRTGEHLDDGRVRVTGTSPSGEVGRWEATVEVLRHVPVPDCGRPIDAAEKSEPELAVVGLESSVLA
jgi:hypothetical protein